MPGTSADRSGSSPRPDGACIDRYPRSRWGCYLIAVIVCCPFVATALNRITAERAEVETQATAHPVTPSSRFLPPTVSDRGWPFVRGPSFDGHSPEINLADSWPAAGPPVLWTRELGQGYSGLVAAGKRVYTQYQDLGGQYVLCLDALTGKTIWKYRYGWPYEMAGLYPYEELARVSLLGGEICWTAPALHRGCVYVRNHSRAVCVYVGKPELLDRKLRNMAMTVQDMPQSKYFDLAAILGVEPEYAFDVPTARWLRIWYLFSVALLAAAMVLALSAWAALRNWTKAR